VSIKKLLAVGILGIVLCVSGCGNGEKVDSNEEFSADDISKIVMDISSWNIEVLASSDDKIHVDYKGKAENSSDVQITQKDNTLMIQQDDGSEKNIAEQFSFGEAGKIALYVPKNTKILWEMNNGSGDVELETVASSDFIKDPYISCTHACKYCYASFMKRFTNHPWGSFLDVKIWNKIKNPKKYAGKELFVGSVTDLYNPQEEIYERTRALLTELQGRSYWEALDMELKEYAAEIGLEYVTNDDSMSRPFDVPPAIVNYFYNREITKLARKGAMRPGDACFVPTGA
jgi:hypothetical protein